MTSLSIGAASFSNTYGVIGNCAKLADVYELLDECLANNVSMIDTAPTYGESEEVLGNYRFKDSLKVTTKISGLLTCTDKKSVSNIVRSSIQQSLATLQVSNVYGILLHESRLVFSPKILGWAIDELKNAQDCGLIEKMGISIYDEEEAENLDLSVINLIQVPMNILDCRFEDSGFLARAKQNGVEVHGRSLFLQGLLLLNSKNLPRQYGKWMSIWEELEVVAPQDPVEKIAFLLEPFSKNELVDSLIIGFNSRAELVQIFEALKLDCFEADSFRGLGKGPLDLIDPRRWVL